MALKYYWWFMTMTAFTGQIFAEMVLSGFNDGLALGSEFRTVLRAVATAIPSTVAANWLNWIIFRLTVTLPWQYMLQVNTFVFEALGMNCCSRAVRGGGPGGPAPYRIYVDSGVALMCVVALAPASPLVAPAALLYFMFCQPLLRRNLIFMYRPKYDGGGLRWPFVFEMFISSMVLGSILLAAQLGLKEALVPGVLAGITLVPILLFQRYMKERYLRPYKDAALLQTSLLDGWNTEGSCIKSREEFRRFLVDAHKAAYVPVCLAATDTDDCLTVEPAVVVPLECDPDVKDYYSDRAGTQSFDSLPELSLPPPVERQPNRRISAPGRGLQRGAMLRRSVNVMSTPQRRATLSQSKAFNLLDSIESLREDDYSLHSPFEGIAARSSIFKRAGASGGKSE
jgi:hypothetical protein